MPITAPYRYKTKKKKFDSATSSELQHKIRVPLKLYTVTNFMLKENNTFEFKHSRVKMQDGNKVIMIDDSFHHGSFIKESISDDEYQITLTFHD